MLRFWVLSFLAAVDSWCPVEACRKKKKEVLLQLSEPNHPLPYSTLARRVHKVHDVDDNGHSMYNIDFKPADFTCLKCDVKTCDSCDVVCDLSMCIGKFYEHECWCRKDTTIRLKTPLWQFRKFDSRFLVDESVHRFFCDDKCGEGACGIQGLQCKPRAEACQPWWWCNLPPPRTQEKTEWPTDEFRETFVQKRTFLQKNSGKNAEKRKFEKNDIGTFHFTRGRWVCNSASYPPQILDPTTYLWQNRGYIVFDGDSCKGATFQHQCYCWDEFKYLKRENAHISAFTCDDKCMLGACDGRTCGDQPPPPLPAPPPPPLVDPLEAEKIGQATLNNIDVEMDEAF